MSLFKDRSPLGQEILTPTTATGISSQLKMRSRVQGKAQSGGASSITLASGESAIYDLYAGCTVIILSGTGAGQVRTISAYDGSTKAATVSLAWLTNPDNTSQYSISHPFEGLLAKCAKCTVELGAVNFATDGSSPTAMAGTNVGTWADPGTEFHLHSSGEIQNFKCIERVAGSGAKVKIVTYA